jgi:hypothetical protein
MLRVATTPVPLNVNEGYYISRYRALFTFPAVPINSAVSTEFIYIYMASSSKMQIPYSIPILEDISYGLTLELPKVVEGY